MFNGRAGYERLPMYASASTPRHRSSSSATSSATSYPSQKLLSPPSLSSSSHTTRRFKPPDRYRSSSRDSKSRFRSRSLFFALVKFVLPAALAVLVLVLLFYEPHVELAFYSRRWVQQEIEAVAPLSGCFDSARVSPKYNLSQALYGERTYELHAGMPLRMGLDCYDFAGTVQPKTGQRIGSTTSSSTTTSTSTTTGSSDGWEEEPRTQFHTYWRTDLAAFGARQEWMLKSFFATQDRERSRLTVWSNGDLSTNEILQGYVRRHPESFALRVVNVSELALTTALEGSVLLAQKDARAWVDGDLVRLLVLWANGGFWVDMDTLMTRSLEPLLEHEFVTQWDCYDKKYQPLNGALMHFNQHSPYLCEAFHIMASSKPPRPGSTDWGSLLYYKLWRRLVAAAIPPFRVLPFCFSDGRSCRLDNRLPDPFAPDNRRGKWTMGLGLEEGGGLDKVLGKVFAVHLHNQWEKEFPAGGWVERLLLRKYDLKLAGHTHRTVGEEL